MAQETEVSRYEKRAKQLKGIPRLATSNRIHPTGSRSLPTVPLETHSFRLLFSPKLLCF